MVRATHGVYRGSYYFEVEILPHTPSKHIIALDNVNGYGNNDTISSGDAQSDAQFCPHIRIGWSTRQGELQAPVGFDQNSFGYRDQMGEWTSPVLSCPADHKLTIVFFLLIVFFAGSKVHKSHRADGYGEPYGPGDVIGCHIALFDDAANNRMSFYRNGVDQGVAFSGTEITSQGIYFPAVSLYMKVSL